MLISLDSCCLSRARRYRWTPPRGASLIYTPMYRFKNNPRAAHMDGKSALIVACEYSRLEIVQMLLGAGASKNLQDHAGKSPLDYASMTRNNAKIIDLLTS